MTDYAYANKPTAHLPNLRSPHRQNSFGSIFLWVTVYWQGVAPFPWYMNAKGPTPIGSTCVAHISPHSVKMRYYVSWKTTGYYTKDSLKLAARCPVSGCWPSCSYIVASKDEQLFPRDCCLEEAWRRRRKRRRRKRRIVTTKNKTSYIEILIANHTWPVE